MPTAFATSEQNVDSNALHSHRYHHRE
jgi:hypothetical protein